MAAGARLVCGAGVQRMQRAEGAWRVDTEAGSFVAPIVINAAGAWCDELARLAGVAPVGLVPKRRTAFTTARIAEQRSAPPAVRAMAHALAAGIVAFCIAGTFLTQGFTWPLYILLALCVAISHFAKGLSRNATTDPKATGAKSPFPKENGHF